MQDQTLTRPAYYHRKRTIRMPENRSRQVAVVAAERGVSGEALIQGFISAGLATLEAAPGHCGYCGKRKRDAG